MMRFAIVVIAVLVGTPAVAEKPWKGKDLKVLPKDISKDKLKEVMKKQSEALGVDCDFCHKVPDMHLDTKHKTAAREMIRMSREINAKFFDGETKVRCATCHRGEKEPPSN